MDPEQLVAQLAELRTQNQQLHQALQQVQQQQNQQQGLVQALSDLPQSLAQTVGAIVLAAASPARTNPTLVNTKELAKPPPLKNKESGFVSWAPRAENFVVSVHLGTRDAEANATTEVVMPLDTLRMLAGQLCTVLMTLVEGESLDILVGSGSGEGLQAWRRLHKRWDPLTTGRARGLLNEILSPGRAKLVELQGAVERLEDLMRRYTQRRDAGNGQRHTLAEDIWMAALEALLPEEHERPCQLQRSRLGTNQKLREEVVLCAEARGTVHPSWVKCRKLEKTEMILWMLEDSDSGKDQILPKGKNPTGTVKGKGTGKDGKGDMKSSGRANTPKTQSQCWNCGKTGHQYKDCWVNLGRWPQQQSQRTFKLSWKGM